MGDTRPEPEGLEMLRLFPNPASGKITIAGATQAEAGVARVYNAQGALVKTLTVTLNRQAALEGLSPGLYNLIFEARGKTRTFRLVLK
jgi:hypothetical protein